MAKEINGKKTGIVSPEIIMQACNLARASCKQDFPACLQKDFSLTVGIFHTALQIFASHHGPYPLKCLRMRMPHFPFPVKYSTEHDSAVFYDFPRHGYEDTSGGT